MDRRQVLAVAGLSTVPLASGCLSALSGSEPGSSVEWAAVSSGIWLTDQEEAEAVRHGEGAILIADRDTAIEQLDSNSDKGREFVDQTDFERSYLVWVRLAMGSGSLEITIERIVRAGEELRITIDTALPPDPDMDLDYYTYFLRITDDRGDYPERIMIRGDGGENTIPVRS